MHKEVGNWSQVQQTKRVSIENKTNIRTSFSKNQCYEEK
jgi:hypothetical protein